MSSRPPRDRSGCRNKSSRPQRVLDFFAANPDEELTLDDARAKFSISKRYARGLLGDLRADGIEVVTIVRRMSPPPDAARARVLPEADA